MMLCEFSWVYGKMQAMLYSAVLVNCSSEYRKVFLFTNARLVHALDDRGLGDRMAA